MSYEGTNIRGMYEYPGYEGMVWVGGYEYPQYESIHIRGGRRGEKGKQMKKNKNKEGANFAWDDVLSHFPPKFH